MQKVSIICVGKLKEKFYIEAAAEYEKRLSRHCRLTIDELPESRLPQNPTAGDIDRALEGEAALIEAKIPKGAKIIAMCIEGRTISSEELSKKMINFGVDGESKICFIIGGSVGMHPSIKARADFKLSMSPMTFPHHMARIMLLEQIYRAYQIADGTRYHK